MCEFFPLEICGTRRSKPSLLKSQALRRFGSRWRAPRCRLRRAGPAEVTQKRSTMQKHDRPFRNPIGSACQSSRSWIFDTTENGPSKNWIINQTLPPPPSQKNIHALVSHKMTLGQRIGTKIVSEQVGSLQLLVQSSPSRSSRACRSLRLPPARECDSRPFFKKGACTLDLQHGRNSPFTHLKNKHKCRRLSQPA